MEFGALYCTPRDMDCESCPVGAFCMAKAHGTAAILPLRKPRAKVKDRWMRYTLYITRAKETVIRQRTNKDIWYKLWEFPLEEYDRRETYEAASSHLSMTCLLSHQRLHIKFLLQETDSLPLQEGAKTIPWDELDDYAFAKPVLTALQQLKHSAQ